MFAFLKSLLFPISCLACRADSGTWLCEHCKKSIVYEPKRQNYPEIHFPIYTLFQANQTIRTLIHGLKYKWYEEASTLFHKYIKNFLLNIQRENPRKNIICIPVPLHPKKLRQRGFNQSEKLIPSECKKLFIQKIQHTPSQMGLSRKQRLTNVKDVFQYNKNLSEENVFVIIDDIVTTGSTLHEVARTLKKSGAQYIIGITISRGT